jgi:hypothetical protein
MMLRKRVCAIAAMLLLSVLVGTKVALAVPIDAFNDRPTTIGASGETTLQTILNNNGWGDVNVATDQSTQGMWGSSSALYPSTTPTILAEFAGFASQNIFGIWSGTDTTAITAVDIFRGAASPGPITGTATLAWDSSDNLYIFGFPFLVNNTLGISGIDPDNFGFYLRRSNGPTFYTVDQLNAGGAPMALAYNHANSTDWVLAFEDVLNLDNDYNDFVVRVGSLNGDTHNTNPVPEPATLVLMGSGFVGLWALRRKHQGKE